MCQMEHTTLPLHAVWASPGCVSWERAGEMLNHLCSHNFLHNFRGRGDSPRSLDKVSELHVGSEMRLGQVLERVISHRRLWESKEFIRGIQDFLGWDLEEVGRKGEHSRQWVLAQEEGSSRGSRMKGRLQQSEPAWRKSASNVNVIRGRPRGASPTCTWHPACLSLHKPPQTP